MIYYEYNRVKGKKSLRFIGYFLLASICLFIPQSKGMDNNNFYYVLKKISDGKIIAFGSSNVYQNRNQFLNRAWNELNIKNQPTQSGKYNKKELKVARQEERPNEGIEITVVALVDLINEEEFGN